MFITSLQKQDPALTANCLPLTSDPRSVCIHSPSAFRLLIPHGRLISRIRVLVGLFQFPVTSRELHSLSRLLSQPIGAADQVHQLQVCHQGLASTRTFPLGLGSFHSSQTGHFRSNHSSPRLSPAYCFYIHIQFHLNLLTLLGGAYGSDDSTSEVDLPR